MDNMNEMDAGAGYRGTIMLIIYEYTEFTSFFFLISSGLSSKRIILSPFTKEFRGEGHSYESLIFSEAIIDGK